MALTKTIQTPYGDATYHVVAEVHATRMPQVRDCVRLNSYRDKAQRNQEGSIPYASEVIEVILDPLGDNVVAQAYDAVRDTSEWEDAIDA